MKWGWSACPVVVFTVLALSSLGCHKEKTPDSQPPNLRNFGLQVSSANQSEVEEAISLANQVIQTSSQIRLVSAWAPVLHGDRHTVYVFIVQDEGLPLKSIAQTKAEAGAIFVSSNWKVLCGRLLDHVRASLDPESITNDVAPTLAVILLHESGHVNTTPMPLAEKLKNTFGPDLYLQEPPAMEKELAADAFAATVLLRSRAESKPSNNVGRELCQVVLDIQKNVDEELYDRFGRMGSVLSFTAKDVPARFLDRSYTHPNMGFRFRVLAYFLDPSEDRKKQVQYYLDMRKTFATPSPPLTDKRILDMLESEKTNVN